MQLYSPLSAFSLLCVDWAVSTLHMRPLHILQTQTPSSRRTEWAAVSYHRLCTELRSGLWEETVLSWSHSGVDLASCLDLLCRWKISLKSQFPWERQQILLRDLSAFCCIHFTLSLYKLSGLDAEQHPHSMMLPLPAFVVEMTCLLRWLTSCWTFWDGDAFKVTVFRSSMWLHISDLSIDLCDL